MPNTAHRTRVRRPNRVVHLSWAIAAALILCVPQDSRAQGGVGGRVIDEQAAPIEGARVELVTAPVRETRTDSNGRFAFTSVAPGAYRLQVRRLGFVALSFEVLVRDSTTAIGDVTMRRVASDLPQVVVRGRWQGIFGFVADSQTQVPLSNAAVHIIGVSSAVRTDTLGGFVVDVKQPGEYVLRLQREGYSPKTITVDVAKDSATEVLATLSLGMADPRKDILWRELDSRTRMRGLNSAVVSAKELSGKGTETLSQALIRSRSFAIKNLRLGSDVCLYVNGEPKPGWTMDAFDVSEILSVEVYGRRGELTNTLAARWPKGQMCGTGTGISPVRLSESERRLQVVSVVIWLKKQ